MYFFVYENHDKIVQTKHKASLARFFKIDYIFLAKNTRTTLFFVAHSLVV